MRIAEHKGQGRLVAHWDIWGSETSTWLQTYLLGFVSVVNVIPGLFCVIPQ